MALWLGVAAAVAYWFFGPSEALNSLVVAVGAGSFGANGFGGGAGPEGPGDDRREPQFGPAFGPDALASAFGPPDAPGALVQATSNERNPDANNLASVVPNERGADFGGLEQAMRDLTHVERLRAEIGSAKGDLWRFHGPVRDAALLNAVHAYKTPVVTFLSSKGGVGKTTLALNTAAYFSRAGLRVLLIDLDDRAALTLTLMRAGRYQQRPSSMVDPVIAGTASSAWLVRMAIPLDAAGLDHARLVSSAPTLRAIELRMFVRWLIESDLGDIRTFLARHLVDPALRNAYDIVLIDTPPRRDAATVNALVASTHVVVPTILDGLSIDAIGPLLQELKTWVATELNPQLKFAGIVPTMTTGPMLSSSEAAARNALASIAVQAIGDQSAVFQATIPHRTAFAKLAGTGIAYHADIGRNSVQEHVDIFCAELVQRLT